MVECLDKTKYRTAEHAIVTLETPTGEHPSTTLRENLWVERKKDGASARNIDKRNQSTVNTKEKKRNVQERWLQTSYLIIVTIALLLQVLLLQAF